MMFDAEIYYDTFNRAVPGMLAAAAETGRVQFDATFATCCSLLAGYSILAKVDIDTLLAAFDWPPVIKELFREALNQVDRHGIFQN